MHGFQVHAAAEPAIAAIGTAEGHKLFTPKTDAAAAAVAGLDLEFGFVDEFHRVDSTERARRTNKKGAGCPTPSLISLRAIRPAPRYLLVTTLT